MVTPDSTSSPPNSPCGEDTIKLNSSVISASSPATSSNFLQSLQFQHQQINQFHMLQQHQHQQYLQQVYSTNYTSTPVDQLFQFDNNSVTSFNPAHAATINSSQRSPYESLQPPPPPPSQSQSQSSSQQQQLPPPPLMSIIPQASQDTTTQPLQPNNFYHEYINEFGNNPQHPYSSFVNPQFANSVNSLPNLDAHQQSSQSQSIMQHSQDYSKIGSAPTETTSFLYNLQNQSTDLMINHDLEFNNTSFDSIGEYSQPGISLTYPPTLQPQQNQFHDSIPTSQVQEYPHTPSHLSEPPLSAGISDVSNFSTVLDESHLYRPSSTIGHKLKSPIPSSTPYLNIHNSQLPPPTSSIRKKITKKSSLSRLNTSSRKNLQASLVQSLSTPTDLEHNSPPPVRIISPILKSKASFANIQTEITDDEEGEEDDDENDFSDFTQPPPPVIGSSIAGNVGLRSISNTSSTSSHGSHHGLPVMNVFRHNSASTVAPSVQLSQPLKKPMKKTRRKSSTATRTTANANANRISSKSSTDSTKTESESGEDFDVGVTPVKKKHTRRRLLPRSKKGCWICRIKHLKCDEVTPVCGGCAKFGLQCDYSPEKPDYVTDKFLRQQKLEEVSLIRKRNQAKTRIPRKKSKKDLKKSTLLGF